ncbi:unnamed protein product [Spirodela intermedia]|uniref:Uncharacterized protein n=1 Tax=Spirodela intermedia TaxID=51605 RepID=A0ABN7EBQ7_SPIIN|nr:unnamed protein product [Spirodela intermedia]
MGAGEISLWKTPSAASPAVTTTATSSPSSSSSSSEISSPAKSCSSTSPSPLEEEILAGLKQPLLASQEAALMLLRTSTRDGGAAVRASLCSHNLLAAILPFLLSRRPLSSPAPAPPSSTSPSTHPTGHTLSGPAPSPPSWSSSGSAEGRPRATPPPPSSASPWRTATAPPSARWGRSRRCSASWHRPRRRRSGSAGTPPWLSTTSPWWAPTSRSWLSSGPAGGDDGCGGGGGAGGDAEVAELPEVKRELCVAALYLMSRGNMRFRALARDAAAEEVLLAVAEGAKGRSRRIIEMAKKAFSAAAATKREEEDAGERLCGSLPEPALRGRRRWRADQQDFRGFYNYCL